ncbi:DUF2293 domain-containing protein [candidate division CSSED10-310 bacterium]|uniref:DUF2293 domain-containing protein n=1 Tax=candidate division CSSED10-310 bacterium TaxID=2855610 RepID=A0ABV6Z414_UNCC1
MDYSRPHKGALCLVCADLDHLLFLPSGNTALTRRARKHSTLVAVVLKWSSPRKRYERQGLLVDEKALTMAEEECLADEDARARRKERAAIKRREIDQKYLAAFAMKIRKLFPGIPEKREITIAEHACLKYSGRVGRSAAAKELDQEAVKLAVIAHIRHTETNYDELLWLQHDRYSARRIVDQKVTEVFNNWKQPR